jgi:hypothetical protein
MAKYRRGNMVELVNQKNFKDLTEMWGNMKSWLKILLERQAEKLSRNEIK